MGWGDFNRNHLTLQMDKGKMKDTLKIVGYFPGAIGKITTLHAVYYREHWGLDHSFEAQVGREVSDFMTRFDVKKDGLWNAVSGNDLAGCIAITMDADEPNDARLRWYIVDPVFHGQGIGKTLIKGLFISAEQRGINAYTCGPLKV